MNYYYFCAVLFFRKFIEDKKMKKYTYHLLLITLVFCFISLSLEAQTFRPAMPLPTKPLLAGNFAELRPNHFHGGIDLKTENREGLQVLAAEEGYISRIKVSPYGYGKMLFITHPNGYVTTYGHLQKYAPEVEAFVKQKQYEKHTYEIDITPEEKQFVVKKGDWVALSGNTGGSQGPHLHFEVRDIHNNGWNPLLFGFEEIADTTPPDILHIYAYSLSEEAQVENTQLPRQIVKNKQVDGTYLSDKVNAIGTIGFGIQGFDRQDETMHKNGIYKVTLLLNGEVQLQTVFDKVNYDDTRYLNALVDYQMYTQKKGFTQLLYRLPNNRLESVYPVMKENRGYLTIEEGQQYTVTIVAEDIKGNSTKVTIPIEGNRLPLKIARPVVKGNKQVVATRDNYYELEHGSVYLPEHTLYEDKLLYISSKKDSITVGNYSIPAQKFFTVSLKTDSYKDEDTSKVFLSRGGSYEPTVYKDGVFTARSRNFGTFTLRKDVTPPTLKAVNFKNGGVVKGDTLKVLVSDNFTGFANCSATLNGEWILFEYEPKNHCLTFHFEDIDTSKTDKYELVVKATDKVGNEGILKATFTRLMTEN